MEEADRLNKIIIRHLITVMIRLTAFICLLFFTFTYVFGIRKIEINDMYPAVCPGDIILFYRLGELKRNDIVITDQGLIGRVQAMEPDTVDVTDDEELPLNGYVMPVQPVRGVFYETYRADGGIDYPVKIRKNEYFILGDKRDTARDSRAEGVLRRKDITGRVFMVIRRRIV